MIMYRRLTWADHVARIGESVNALKTHTGKATGSRCLRRHRNRHEDNIRKDLKQATANVKVELIQLRIRG